MKFPGKLSEATLLRRTQKFLAEIVSEDQQKTMIRCPNLGNMSTCETLGSRIWYSNATGYHYLPTWEIVEVDYGHLVAINPEIIKPLVFEAIQHGLIDDLSNYDTINVVNQVEHIRNNIVLLNRGYDICVAGLDQIVLGDVSGNGYFPNTIGEGIDNLQTLIQARADGHRAMLIYCVMHTGVSVVCPDENIDPEYGALLHEAVACGVELLAYRVSISPLSIELTTQLPVLFAKDAMLK